MQKVITLGNMRIGNTQPFVLIGGMNVLESDDLALQLRRALSAGLRSGWVSVGVQGVVRQGQSFVDCIPTVVPVSKKG
jgi:hypothetical protein